MLIYVGAQYRLFRFRLSGIAHFFIFWGFLTLSLTILQAILEGLVAFNNPHFIMPVIGYWGLLALLQDFFAFFVKYSEGNYAGQKQKLIVRYGLSGQFTVPDIVNLKKRAVNAYYRLYDKNK